MSSERDNFAALRPKVEAPVQDQVEFIARTYSTGEENEMRVKNLIREACYRYRSWLLSEVEHLAVRPETQSSTQFEPFVYLKDLMALAKPHVNRS